MEVSYPGDVYDIVVFDDPNLDPDAEYVGKHLLYWFLYVLDADITTEDDSPYPEVRSAVANTDDPYMPCSTFRSWTLGLVWAVVIPGVNQFFFFRFPAVEITGVCSFHFSMKLEVTDKNSDCSTITQLSYRLCMGEICTQCSNIWCCHQSWTIHC